MRVHVGRRLLRVAFDCRFWQAASTNTTAQEALQFRYSHHAMRIDSSKSHALFQKAVAQLMAYRIYPPSRMTANICARDGMLEEGATIIQRILLGPIGFEVATRVVSTFTEHTGPMTRKGFTYITLVGHPERGIATFSVSRDDTTHQVVLEIETYSEPGHWLSRVVLPLTRLIQRRSNEQALQSFKASLLREE